MGQTRPLFVYFRPFLNAMTNIVQNLAYKCVDGVHGIETRVRRMVGSDKPTENWWPHKVSHFY